MHLQLTHVIKHQHVWFVISICTQTTQREIEINCILGLDIMQMTVNIIYCNQAALFSLLSWLTTFSSFVYILYLTTLHCIFRCVQSNIVLLTQAFRKKFVIPDFQTFSAHIDQLYENARILNEGQVCTLIYDIFIL